MWQVWRTATLTHPLYLLTWNKNWHNRLCTQDFIDILSRPVRFRSKFHPYQSHAFWPLRSVLSCNVQNSDLLVCSPWVPRHILFRTLVFLICSPWDQSLVHLRGSLGVFCAELSSGLISVGPSVHSAQNSRLLVCSTLDVSLAHLRESLGAFCAEQWSSGLFPAGPSTHSAQNSRLLCPSAFCALAVQSLCVRARALCTSFVQLVFSISKLFTATNLTESIDTFANQLTEGLKNFRFCSAPSFPVYGKSQKGLSLCVCVSLRVFVPEALALSKFNPPAKEKNNKAWQKLGTLHNPQTGRRGDHFLR